MSGPSVSIKKETYDRLKERAKADGVPVEDLLERILSEAGVLKFHLIDKDGNPLPEPN